MANNFLSGTAFIDSDGDGQLGASESYLPNATIQLRSSDGLTLIGTDITDAKGAYFFDNLVPGDYKLVNLSATGYAGTSSQSLSKISPVTSSTANTVNVTLADPADLQASLDINAFFTSNLFRSMSYTIYGTTVSATGGQLPAKLHSSIFSPNPTSSFLTLCTGLFDDLIVGVNGPFAVTPGSAPTGTGAPHNAERIAYLYNHFGQTPQGPDGAAALQVAVWELLYDADSSDPDGDLSSGNFRINSASSAVISQANALLASSVGKAESAIFLNVLPPSPATPTATQRQSIIVTGSFNFGNRPEARVGDFVWEDLNANGIQDLAEPGIANVTVKLRNGLGNIIATTATNVAGHYLFDQLVPGTYSVEFVAPGGYVYTGRNQGADDSVDSDADLSTLQGTATTTLAAGQEDLTLDAGFYRLASLGDFVWHDLNADGTQDSGEPGIVGATVNLLKDGVPIDTTTTGAGGIYSFTDLVPGNYSVQFVQPAGFTQVSPANVGSDLSDSDGDSALTTAVVTLASGDNNITLDQGFYNLASLGDFVWHDLNADGTQDASEPGIVGATVNLLKDGVPIDTTTTGAGGIYSFTDLVPGNYSVQFVQPAGFTRVSPANVGSDLSDSDGGAGLTTATVMLASGDNNITLDQGFYKLASLGDFVWHDLNADGTQDASEPGIVGATVNLLKDGVPTGATTLTGAGGIYSFTDLVPGNYSVQFVQPAGFTQVSPANIGSDSSDSDGDSALTTAAVTLASGDNNVTLDQGFYKLPSNVCVDINLQGNTSTYGSAGNIRTFAAGSILVKASAFSRDNSTNAWESAYLGSYPGGLGVTDTSEGSGGNNSHTVDNIGRINYVLFEFSQVVVVDAAFLGYVVGDSDLTVWIGSAANAFNNHQNLSDAFLAGLGFSELNLTTLTTTRMADLNASEVSGNILVIAARTNDANRDDQFKIAQLAVCAPSVQETAALGDFVWHDVNGNGLQDTGEPGIPNATVTLRSGGADGLINGIGDIDKVTTTDAGGRYSFTNLAPGVQYRVTFSAPAGYDSVTTRQAGSDTTDDSDGLVSDIIVLGSGEVNKTIDAGFTATSAVCVDFHLEGNSSASGTAGNVRTFSSGGVSVKASGFSRDSNGSWQTAYLGSYSGGLGVTDTSEGSGANNTHTVDNVGRDNYVLFEFSQLVQIESAFLGYVVGDSDLSVWIGTLADPFNNHTTLSDSMLSSLGFSEVNLTGSSATRTADLNAGGVYGNVLVIAAWTHDDTPDDRFKIAELSLCANVSASSVGTKFFVADNDLNKTFKYGSTGGFIEKFGVAPWNPMGITANATGQNVWIADYSGQIYQYSSSGTLLANWNSMAKHLQGVTTNGTHIWTVSDYTNKVYYYKNGASATTNRYATSSFSLHPYNANPTDLTTDGTYIWVVNEGNLAGGVGDMVFKYTVGGQYLGRWQLDGDNSRPTGITIDPSGGSKIWIVDNGNDRVFEYSGATGVISGGLVAAKSFALAAGNTNPQGIADPPVDAEASEAVNATESSLLMDASFINPVVNALRNSFNATDVNDDGITSALDALIIINRLNVAGPGTRNSANADGEPWTFEDVNGDGLVTPLDALYVINHLNSGQPLALPEPEILPALPDAEGAPTAAESADAFFADLAGSGEAVDVEQMLAPADDATAGATRKKHWLVTEAMG